MHSNISWSTQISQGNFIFKKGDKLLFDNYRFISLLTAISKIFEHVVSNQPYDHLTNHNLLFAGQYGFRKSSFYRICCITFSWLNLKWPGYSQTPNFNILRLIEGLRHLKLSNFIAENINYQGFDWLAVNKLSLNISKTKFIQFHDRQTSWMRMII